MTTTAEKAFSCVDPTTAHYAVALCGGEDPVLTGIRGRAAAAGLPDIHVSAVDGRHLTVLALASGAIKAVEVGTLAGYSGVCLLRGMPQDGVLHTCELDPAHAAVARDTFAQAGYAQRAHIHVGQAADTLSRVAKEGPFDLMFIDADKQAYPAYLAWAAQHLKVGGMLLADNVFLWGTVGRSNRLATSDTPRETVDAMRAFNAAAVDGPVFKGTLLPTGEGLALAVRVR